MNGLIWRRPRDELERLCGQKLKVTRNDCSFFQDLQTKFGLWRPTGLFMPNQVTKGSQPYGEVYEFHPVHRYVVEVKAQTIRSAKEQARRVLGLKKDESVIVGEAVLNNESKTILLASGDRVIWYHQKGPTVVLNMTLQYGT